MAITAHVLRTQQIDTRPAAGRIGQHVRKVQQVRCTFGGIEPPYFVVSNCGRSACFGTTSSLSPGKEPVRTDHDNACRRREQKRKADASMSKATNCIFATV